MDVYEAIKARRTIRHFDGTPIELSVIERIVDAGLRAPTNDHLRSWEFVIVNDEDRRAKLLKVEDLVDRETCDNGPHC